MTIVIRINTSPVYTLLLDNSLGTNTIELTKQL